MGFQVGKEMYQLRLRPPAARLPQPQADHVGVHGSTWAPGVPLRHGDVPLEAAGLPERI